MSKAISIDREEVQAIVDLLRELLTWAQLAYRPQVAEHFVEILDSDQKKLVYEYSDGKRGVRAIEELTGVNKAIVSSWWADWEAQGIVEQSKAWKGRRQRLISLQELGIEVPALPSKEEK